MAQAGVWSADKRLKNPDFSGCGAPWRESRRFQVPFLAPSVSSYGTHRFLFSPNSMTVDGILRDMTLH